MKNITIIFSGKKNLLVHAIVCLLLLHARATAQEPPPRAISVFTNPAEGLIFGAFFQGASGGTVIISPEGSRSVTGGLILANFGVSFSSATFEIDADPGSLISILNGPDVTLTGSNGGTLRLHIGGASTGASFTTTATPPSRTVVRIGGTLTAGNAQANPSGTYSGSFSITFIQE